MAYTPTTGDRVTITRTRPDGSIRFVKVGLITGVDQFGFEFLEDNTTRRRFASYSEDIAKTMHGWSQTIEPTN